MEQRKTNWLVLAASMVLLAGLSAGLVFLARSFVGPEPVEPSPQRAALYPQVYAETGKVDEEALDILLHGSFRDLTGPDGEYTQDLAEKKLYRLKEDALDFVGDVVRVRKAGNLAGMAAGKREGEEYLVGPDGKYLFRINRETGVLEPV